MFSTTDASVDTGVGDDIVTIGDNFSATTFDTDLLLGESADQITIGSEAGRFDLFLGSGDGDADTLVFISRVSNLQVLDFELGLDKADVRDPNDWTLADDGTTTTLSDGSGNNIKFVGISGA